MQLRIAPLANGSGLNIVKLSCNDFGSRPCAIDRPLVSERVTNAAVAQSRPVFKMACNDGFNRVFSSQRVSPALCFFSFAVVQCASLCACNLYMCMCTWADVPYICVVQLYFKALRDLTMVFGQ